MTTRAVTPSHIRSAVTGQPALPEGHSRSQVILKEPPRLLINKVHELTTFLKAISALEIVTPIMPNYDLLAVPAMWLTAIAPHSWAIGYIKKHNKGRFDNANSKTQAFGAKLQANVPADVLARFERAEAAHRNGLENLPLFAVGVLAANCMLFFLVQRSSHLRFFEPPS